MREIKVYVHTTYKGEDHTAEGIYEVAIQVPDDMPDSDPRIAMTILNKEEEIRNELFKSEVVGEERAREIAKRLVEIEGEKDAKNSG